MVGRRRGTPRKRQLGSFQGWLGLVLDQERKSGSPGLGKPNRPEMSFCEVSLAGPRANPKPARL